MPCNLVSTSSCLVDFDKNDRVAIAFQLDVYQSAAAHEVHQHRKSQLAMPVRGSMMCEAQQGVWMVPPQHAVWIPAGVRHSNRATANARICFLIIEPAAVNLPNKCCTMVISPMIRELILYLSDQDAGYDREGSTARLAAVLLEQLSNASVDQLHLPISDHPKIQQITYALTKDLADRRTLAQWARNLAMSERSLARLVQRETGLSFGRWRRQLHLIGALRQLAEGLSVQRVAANLGYESVTAFITMFKKALGKSPAQYFESVR